MEQIQTYQTYITDKVNVVLKNPYVMAILKVCLILYASQLAPRAPPTVSNFFSNTFVKIIAIALLAYISELDFQLAIILAIIFVLGTNILSGRGILESYGNLTNLSPGQYQSDMTKYTTLLGKPVQIHNAKLIESISDTYPGCTNVTLSDLLNIFDGDRVKLQKTVTYTFTELNKALPKGTGKENLIKIARAVGLPYNVELNDANAPLIATILLNYGYKISETCQVPQ
jgi:small basic protein